MAEGGLTEIREQLHSIRGAAVQREPGRIAVQRLARVFQTSTGVSVRLEMGNMPLSCGVQVDSLVYHLVQEGMTNSFRHGNATLIEVLLWHTGERALITLRDNGSSAKTFQEDTGLSGMRERVEDAGGEFAARTAPSGFTLQVSVPHQKAAS